jgi:hypothetical protein
MNDVLDRWVQRFTVAALLAVAAALLVAGATLYAPGASAASAEGGAPTVQAAPR